MSAKICYTNDDGGWSLTGYQCTLFAFGFLPSVDFIADSFDVWVARFNGDPPGTLDGALWVCDASYCPQGAALQGTSSNPAWAGDNVPVKASFLLAPILLHAGTKYAVSIGTAEIGRNWFPAIYFKIRRGSGGKDVNGSQYWNDALPPMPPDHWGGWTASGVSCGYMSVNGPPAVSITSVAPGTGNREQTKNVVIAGTGFTADAIADFGTDILVNSTTFDSAIQLTVNITIGASAALGVRSVSVFTTGGVGTKAAAFTVESGSTLASGLSAWFARRIAWIGH